MQDSQRLSTSANDGATPEEVFAARVRSERERQGLSQARVADRMRLVGVDIDATAITRIERGERRVRLNEAVALAQALQLELQELVMPDAGSLEEQLKRAVEVAQRAEVAATYWGEEARLARDRLVRIEQWMVRGKEAEDGVDQEA
ncbi:helix-turn-helix domain-containing protein [Nocardioides antri]|uniref:Helix-turn-helix transcriptional regulator n=1 Tax=Nocardioides antri TaxID=2607659 RepID=A0A5B1M0K9_9ACTN|nr:helix-turn-helix transcriptional regulator [Nocardioides antri]KAA1426473.1 helix-turn-helix transcriptional regulator [Nocardioides antri]